MGCSGGKNTTSQGGNKAGGGGGTDKKANDGTLQHSDWIMDNPGKILENYEMDKKKLGEGSYGSVCKAKHKATGMQRAVKTIAKAQMKNKERFKMEIAIMKTMDHPNIIKLYESFEDVRNIYLVMEIAAGGELFDRIIEAGHFTEVQAAILMQQIIRAIYYMHDNKVCHRDLKPENFLFMSKDKIEKSNLKIIDFGLSCRFEPGQVLTTKAGTPYYVAPQVLAGKYDELSDLWSVGVIMYVMLCGYPPFFGETDAEVLSKVRLGNFSFNATDWKNISEDAKGLIRLLLKMNPKERISAQKALEHPWIKNKAPQAKQVNLQDTFMKNLSGFRSQNKLKKAALHVIASQLNDEQIRGLREIFVALDANGDGTLTLVEMKNGLEKAQLKEIPPDLQAIMEDIDTSGNGQIDYTEFLASTIDTQKHIKADVCWQAFRAFDKNGDGVISLEELKEVIRDGDVKALASNELMAEVDKSGDGKIDFEEFLVMMGIEDAAGIGTKGPGAK